MRRLRPVVGLLACLLTAPPVLSAIGADTGREKPLAVGEQAPAPTLQDTTGKRVDLEKLFADEPTVLVVLRGFPGYQCGMCSRQAAGYLKAADQFAERGVRVVLVYPGGVSNLGKRAEEFLDEKPLPRPLTMVLDPDYQLTNAYGLRWDAPHETAYPSTFIIGADRRVLFAKVSKSHGGRVAAKDVLQELAK